MLQCCDARGDPWGEEMRIRLEGCVSDLHAAGARYHKDCYSAFYNLQGKPSSSIKGRPSTSSSNQHEQAFLDVVRLMKQESSHAFSSQQLFNNYIDFSGKLGKRFFQ